MKKLILSLFLLPLFCADASACGPVSRMLDRMAARQAQRQAARHPAPRVTVVQPAPVVKVPQAPPMTSLKK